MFALKVIVVCLAVLAVGRSATRCGPDESVQFDCQSPTCVNPGDGELSQGKLLISPKSIVTIVGTNEKSYFIKNKEKFSIVPKNTLRVTKQFPNSKLWKFKVNIHKNTYDVCESNSQSNEDNHYDSNIAHTSTDTDETKDQTNDATDSLEMNVGANTDFSINEDEDISVENENNEESDLDSSFPFNTSNKDGVNTNLPSVSDQGSNTDHVNTEENNSSPKPTSSQKLENDSSAECTLDSCSKDANVDEIKLEKKFDSKESTNNDSPANGDSSYRQETSHYPTTELPGTNNSDEKTSNNKTIQNINETNNTVPFHSNPQSENVAEKQNASNHQHQGESNQHEANNLVKEHVNNNLPSIAPYSMNSQGDNNIAEESKISGYHQQQNTKSQTSQEASSTNKKDNLAKEPVNHNTPSDPPNSFNHQDKNNVTEEQNASNHQHQTTNSPTSQDSTDTNEANNLVKEHVNYTLLPIAPYSMNSQGDNSIAEESKMSGYHQQQNTKPQTSQEASSTNKEDNLAKEPVNHNTPSDPPNSVNQQDKNNVTEEQNASNHQHQTINSLTSQDSTVTNEADNLVEEHVINTLPPIAPNSMNSLGDNNTAEESKISGYHQQQNTKSQTSQEASSTNKEDDLAKEPVNHNTPSDPQNSFNQQDKNNVTEEQNASNHQHQTTNSPTSQDSTDTNEANNLVKEHVNYTLLPIAPNSMNSQGDNNTAEESQMSGYHQQQNIKSQNTNSGLLPDAAEVNNQQESNNETDNLTTSNVEADNIDDSNKKSSEQCTSANGCTQKYSYENNQHQYTPENTELPNESVPSNIESIKNDKTKEFESKSFVASFGHPDACSGVGCLKFKRNVEKAIKPLNPVVKQVDSDVSSHSINTDMEIESKNVIQETTDEPYTELSFLDWLTNWLSSPTLNTIDFLSSIFGEYSDAHPDQIIESQEIDNEYRKYVDHSELYFIVVAVVTLLFSLAYYKYQTGTYENHLLTLLAAKDQCLLILEKELSLLKEQDVGNTTSTLATNSEIEALKAELASSEEFILVQRHRIERLEQESEEISMSGMQMHRLLTSALQSSGKNKDQVIILKEKLADSEKMVSALTQKNFEKATELEKMRDSLKTLQSAQDELQNYTTLLDEDNSKMSTELENIITKNKLKESKLLSEINSLKFDLDKKKNALITMEKEVSQSKDALQEVLSQKFNQADSKKFSSSVKLSAELEAIKQICEDYKHKLDKSLKSNQQYLDNVEALKNDIADLEKKLLKTEKERDESINKLNILTKFFKEQEKEYERQINEKSMLFDHKDGESSDLHERIKSLNQEVNNYKLEILSLKKEITDQEDSFKIQISAADKKASDYWISFRQAERKLKEMELESAQLRNKLTMVDKKLENGAKSIDSSKDFDDELLDIPLPTLSPNFTLLDFEPPPPILTNERLPPLGALGQAPSPPVPLSRRHNRSISPGSPPPPHRTSLFRPLPQRYNYMNRQNSLGHSSESLDK